ncbi:MAG: Hpt domain-containing protein [Gemmatimonadota bacterium]|jgi:HPt (histidine-containing phosphotransfer) domain-containing protein
MPEAADAPAIDIRALDRLRKWGGENLPPKMIQIFLDHSSERLEQITDGVARQDPRRAELGAHSLKSSAGNVGASRLQTLCQDAERLAEDEDMSALAGLLPELDRAYSTARKELEKILEGMRR